MPNNMSTVSYTMSSGNNSAFSCSGTSSQNQNERAKNNKKIKALSRLVESPEYITMTSTEKNWALYRINAKFS